MPGTAPAALRTLAQRPREADPGYDLPASSSLSDADSFLGVRPLVNLLAGLCGQVRAVPLPGVPPACLPAPGTPDGDRAAIRLRPVARPGGPWSGGRWHGLRVLARTAPSGASPTPRAATARARAGSRATPRTSAAGIHGRARAPADPDGRGHRRVDARRGGLGGRAARHRGDHPGRAPGTRLRTRRPGPGRPRVPSREAIAAKIEAGKHFAWRISSSWKLRRSRRPLSDGTWKAAITWRGRTYKVRVIEYHVDQVLDLPPGHPLLTAPPQDRPSAPWTTAARTAEVTAGCAGHRARSAWRYPRPSPSSPP